MTDDPIREAAAIRDARATQTAALAREDVEAVAAFWTADVTIRRALGHAIDGALAARKAFERAPSAPNHLVYRRVSTRVDVSTAWPLAFEEGDWAGHLGGAAGPAIIGGRYAAQWVKRDGRWLIRSEVFVALHCTEAGRGLAALP